MAKRKHDEQELPFVALMDTMTNVVGVLIIVLVMVGLSISDVVKTVLSELPPVTPDELAQIREEVKTLPKLLTPEQIEEQKQKAETDLKKAIEDLKTVDTADLASKMKSMDLDTYRKQLADRKKEREAKKAETDKLLAEVERLKALLDQTPVYQPPAPKIVRLPNPRAYPEKPDETRILVAKQGVLSFHQTKFMQPILDGMDKVKSQLEYVKVDIAPFAKMLAGILGTPAAAQQAWAEIAPLVDRVQMDTAAQGYKALADAGIPPTKQILSALADIAVRTRSTLPIVAAAVASATKGDLAPWVKLDPSADPLKPIIKATSAGGKVTFSWGAVAVVVKATPKDVLDYFVKDLGKMKGIEDASKARTIYDYSRIITLLQRAASNPTFTGSYAMEPKAVPAAAYVQLALTPKGGGGETIEALKQPNSVFTRLMRDIKADPNGVAVFQVMPDAFEAYLEARKVADDVGVAATWEFLTKLDLAINVTGYEVQRTVAVVARKPAPAGTAPVGIAPPKKTLD